MTANFVWDEAKRLANQRKHGLDFNAAAAAFEDPNGIDFVEHVGGEERWRLIGMTPTGLLHVVYVERDGKIRIISVRRATPHEARTYYASEAD
jgi:uncharacterized protein